MKEEQRYVCVVPVRQGRVRLEFCLCRASGSHRWQFPEAAVEDGAADHELAERVAREALIAGRLATVEPFARQTNVRDGHVRHVSIFVYLSDGLKPDGDELEQHRWCLAEEARLRLRQKSMRRLVDAVRHALDNGPVADRGSAGEMHAAGETAIRS